MGVQVPNKSEIKKVTKTTLPKILWLKQSGCIRRDTKFQHHKAVLTTHNNEAIENKGQLSSIFFFIIMRINIK